jgi:hypothetical protein
MKIILNDVTEEAVDRLEDAFNTLVSVHTVIWDGRIKDLYQYEIEIIEDPEIATGKDYRLEHISVLFKEGSYLFEIMNASQMSTVEIMANEVMSILIK